MYRSMRETNDTVEETDGPGLILFQRAKCKVELCTVHSGNTEENHTIHLRWGVECQEEVQEDFLEEMMPDKSY